MNEPLIERQASSEISNVLHSALLNDPDLSRSERDCRLLSERGNSRVASRFDNFVDSYDPLPRTLGSAQVEKEDLGEVASYDLIYIE
jgi:hypothetical protein